MHARWPRGALSGPRPAGKQPGHRPSGFAYSQDRLRAGLRRLPYRPLPVPDESLLSYVQRLAHEHNLSTALMLERLGLTTAGQPGGRRLTGFSLRLSDEHVSRVAQVAGLEVDQVRQLLLSRYDGVAFTLDPNKQALQLHWQRRHNWLHLYDSHVCPDCLAERAGAWQLRWKFALVVACSEHQRQPEGSEAPLPRALAHPLRPSF